MVLLFEIPLAKGNLKVGNDIVLLWLLYIRPVRAHYHPVPAFTRSSSGASNYQGRSNRGNRSSKHLEQKSNSGCPGHP
ncbi:hypothetical protein F5Y10DRAFT_239619 [Nemania abortiva]|nr:hypothetical protein F5Y10DRAFT_239619 [Nemania abortiva]